MHLDPEFRDRLEGWDVRGLAATEDVVYVIDSGFRLRGWNPAWESFARANEGQTVLERFTLGVNILTAIDEEIRGMYVTVFSRALASGEPTHHRYECSSPDTFREFYQTAYPLDRRAGLVLTNHLIEEYPHPLAPGVPLSRTYLKGDGVVEQCSHCRKTRDQQAGQKWDWVPSTVLNPPEKLEFSLCPACRSHYRDLVS